MMCAASQNPGSEAALKLLYLLCRWALCLICDLRESVNLSTPISIVGRQDEVGIVISTLAAERVRDELHGLCLGCHIAC